MAEDNSKSNCKFKEHIHSTNCSFSSPFQSVNSFPIDKQNIILTEIGLLPSNFTRSFEICENHLAEILYHHKTRKYQKTCAIPNFMCAHNDENQKRRGKITADRHLSFNKVLEIQKSTGIVLPVDTGKKILWNNGSIPFLELMTLESWKTDDPTVALHSDNEEESDMEPPPKQRRIDQVFYCPNSDCLRAFKTMSSLESHTLIGNCNAAPTTLDDKCKVLYKDKLDNLNIINTCATLDSDDEEQQQEGRTNHIILDRGWALRSKKPKVAFTEDQKSYLIEKFNVGKVTGKKEDPTKVAGDMPFLLRNGKRRFQRKDYLTATQVASFFSRLSQKDRKGAMQDEGDYIAAASEKMMSDLKQEALSIC